MYVTNRILRALSACLIYLLASSAPALAGDQQTIQAREDILNAGRDYLTTAAAAQHTGRVEVEMGRLDSRLRLSRCNQPLEAFQASGARQSGHTSVGVRCPDDGGWSIYITADIKIFGEALVTSRSLARGESLSSDTVKLIQTDISNQNYGYFSTTDEVEGMVTRRPLPAGTVLTQTMVKAPRLIRRGDRVVLVNQQGAIQVEMSGEAISDGAKGDRIRVRALNSKNIVEGWVESASVVKVTL